MASGRQQKFELVRAMCFLISISNSDSFQRSNNSLVEHNLYYIGPPKKDLILRLVTANATLSSIPPSSTTTCHFGRESHRDGAANTNGVTVDAGMF
jgi:hypothetical protein